MKSYRVPTMAFSLFAATTSLLAQTREYGYSFEGESVGAIATDEVAWNYTDKTSFSGSGDPGTTANLLLLRGDSTSSDYSIEDISDTKGIYIRTANMQNANFGVYLMNLDLRPFEIGVPVEVSYSFKILGNDTNGNIIPNNWQVRYTDGATTAGVASFENVDSTFNFFDTGSTWTTVSGTFMTSTGSDRGGILINAGTSGSGYTSGGGVYIADYSVTVSSSAIPEPAETSLALGILGALCIGITRRSSRKG